MLHRPWSLVLACCLVSGSLFAQSLADMAKKEKERRKKSEKPADVEVYVITEYDLSKARGSGGDVESTVTTGSDDDKDDGRPSCRRAAFRRRERSVPRAPLAARPCRRHPA